MMTTKHKRCIRWD